MNLSVVLDGAGKSAAGVGVILGMSYFSGLFRMVGFYGELNADWMLDMMDVQAYISEGLPLTSLLLLLFSAHFFGMKRVSENYRGWFVLVLVVFTSVVTYLNDLFFLSPVMNYYSTAGVQIGLVGAALAAWLAHGSIYPSRSTVDLYIIFLPLALVLVISPYLAGKAGAADIKNARADTTEIIDINNHVVGVLVKVLAEKYLVLDCNVQGQLSFYEVSASLKLRRSSGTCRAFL